MDVGIAIITSVFGSAGFFGLLQFLVSRHDTKARDMQQIKHKLDQINKKCDRNERSILRLQLIFLIESQPTNKDTIMQAAERYFVSLKGNGEAWAIFHHWAKSNDIDTEWYLRLLEKEKEKGTK